MSSAKDAQSTNQAMRSIPREKNSASDPFLIVGGSGRLGGMLRIAWQRSGEGRAVWQARRPLAWADHVFDPMALGAAYRAAARGASAVFNLAGAVGGADALALHVPLALAALEAARAAGVPWVFLVSSAAVYGAFDGLATEAGPARPVSAYGRAKLDMEQAVFDWTRGAGPGAPGVTCLRVGNVAGADLLLADRDRLICDLDVLPDGRAPRRSYIGPMALASVLSQLVSLAARGRPLPAVLNVALDGSVGMDALLRADRCGWRPRRGYPAPIPEVWLDVSRLAALVDLPGGGGDARSIIADLHLVAGPRPRRRL